MSWLLLLCALGLPAGFLLMRRIPLCRPARLATAVPFSIIIPARNEERNIAPLLDSIARSSLQPDEVIVVDDGSTDRTAQIARSHGARVIASDDLPRGWTGKTWACHQGALAAATGTFLFLDADTRLETDGLEKIFAEYRAGVDVDAAFSVLPYHETQKPYEELSLFFNLLMAMGAGGFGSFGKPFLFGQSLLIAGETYRRSGGHRAVREHILENFALASHVYSAGSTCVTRGGRGAIHIRMFPESFAQLREGWTKAFADGASASPRLVLAISVYWLTAAIATFLMLFSVHSGYLYPALLYAGFVLQLFFFSRQIGNYRLTTCLFYPVPLMFYFAVFGESFYRRIFRRTVVWRGREI